MSDKQDPEYWSSIREGDFVSLTDYQSIAASGAGGKDYPVKQVRLVVIPDKESGNTVAEYRIHELTSEDKQVLYFVVVRVGAEFELRVYFLPQGFSIGTRDRLIDLGQTWFFLPPPDPDDFISSELEYAPYPDVPPVEENGAAEKRDFEPGGFGHPIYGYYRTEGEEVPVIIIEYSTPGEQVLNPLILILEERWILPDGTVPQEGGLVMPLLGCTILPDSVETYPGT
ncbi:MAG TPA: hypothetical protein VMW69_13035 [Spirochaetia bacterium]|nr:hypothetical protein [Spirochaetia bacterium]